MDVSQLYEILIPFSPQIICGKNGLQRPVESVEVMEVTNVEDWVSPKTVLLTNFYALKNDIKSQKLLIEKLSTSGSSGLILKIGRFVESLSPEVIQLAEKRSFPIITIQNNISYMQVLTPIYKYLENNSNVPKINNEKTENDQLQYVLDIIEYSTVFIPYIEDTKGNLLFKSRSSINDLWRDKNNFYSVPKLKNYQYVLSEIVTQLNIENKHSLYSEKLKRVLIPLKLDKEIIGILHLPTDSDTTGKLNEPTTIDDFYHQISQALIEEIVKLQEKDLNEINYLIDWKNTKKERSLLLFDIPELNNTKFDRKRFRKYYFPKIQIYEFLKNTIKTENLYIFYENSYIYVLLEILNSKETKDIIKNIQMALPNSILSKTHIAISKPVINEYDFTQQKLSLPKIIKAGKLLNSSSSIYTYDQLGIYAILMKLSDNESINYVNNVISPIEEKDPILLKTLEIYLYENLNASRTAEKLFVDRRTVTYRLNKIKEQFNIDLNDSDTIFKLNLCLRLRKIQ